MNLIECLEADLDNVEVLLTRFAEPIRFQKTAVVVQGEFAALDGFIQPHVGLGPAVLYFIARVGRHSTPESCTYKLGMQDVLKCFGTGNVVSSAFARRLRLARACV